MTNKSDRADIKSVVLRHLHNQGAHEKRAVVVHGRKTSTTVEPVFWGQLCEIAAKRGVSVHQLVSEIDVQRDGSLSSAIPIFVLENVTNACHATGMLFSPPPHYPQ